MMPVQIGNCVLHHGDCRRVLKRMPNQRWHNIITSPPYWGQRDYGLEPIAWPAVSYAPTVDSRRMRIPRMEACLGLENSPEAFIGHLVAIFREARRVLRDDGVLWLNLGDSYAYDGKWGGKSSGKHDYKDGHEKHRATRQRRSSGLPSKSLVGLPWRVAFALQADGWILRQWLPWLKRNPMRESCHDRPQTSIELIFQFSKCPVYHYDDVAVRRPSVGGNGGNDFRKGKTKDRQESDGLHRPVGQGQRDEYNTRGLVNGDLFYDSLDTPYGGIWLGDDLDEELLALDTSVGNYAGKHMASYPEALPLTLLKAGTSERGCCADCGAPWRRVTAKDRAPTRPGTKSKLWPTPNGWQPGKGSKDILKHHQTTNPKLSGNRDTARHITEIKTLGWRPTCRHYPRADEWEPYRRFKDKKNPTPAELAERERVRKVQAELLEAYRPYVTVPCRVLDPFSGVATTGLACNRLGLEYTGIEASEEYLQASIDRLRQFEEEAATPLFAGASASEAEDPTLFDEERDHG